MRRLPLYKDTKQPLDTSERLPLTSSCTRCDRHTDARTVCMQSDVQSPMASRTGGVLVVGSTMSKAEDNAGRPFSSGPNLELRKVIGGLTQLPVVYTMALRCWKTPLRRATEKEVDACRPYLATTLDAAKPERILCLGKEAFMSVLGSSTPPENCRGGYGHLDDGTPVFLLSQAHTQLSNKFLSRRYKKEIAAALTSWPERAPIKMDVFIVEDELDDEEAAEHITEGDYFSFDVETSGLIGADYFEILCLAAANQDASAVYLWPSECLRDLKRSKHLREALADEGIGKVGHNLKYDWKATAHGLSLVHPNTGEILLRGVYGDTLLWCRSLDSDMKARLAWAAELVGMGGHKKENAAALAQADALVKEARANPRQPSLRHMRSKPLLNAVLYPTTKPGAFSFGLVPKDVLFRYCALDTVSTARLAKKLKPIVDAEPAKTLCTEMFYKPSTSALAQIELWGMSADADACRMASKVLHNELDGSERAIRAAGCTIENLNSNDQLSKYLYETLKLPVLGETDSGNPSVDGDTLAKLRGKHPVIEHLINRAQVNTLIKTYSDGLLPHIRGGRIRTTIKQDGTRSGRFSSADPNLQNIPSGGRWAKMIKNIFNAPPGHVLIQLDYSQLELRIAAMLTRDPVMTQIYKDGVDLHRRTAELICGPMWGLEPHQLNDDEHRRPAKGFNFGLWYGQGDATIAENLGITIGQAALLRKLVLGEFVVAAQWIDECRAYTAKHGVAWTMWDGQQAHCRQLPDIASSDDFLASRARNGSFNTPVQGTAAHFMERTITAAVDWILRDGIPARITNTVHDSLIIECPQEWAREVIAEIKHIMESWPSGDVPLVADADVGLSWGALMKMPVLDAVYSAVANDFSLDEICHTLNFLDDNKQPDHDKAKKHIHLAKLIAA